MKRRLKLDRNEIISLPVKRQVPRSMECRRKQNWLRTLLQSCKRNYAYGRGESSGIININYLRLLFIRIRILISVLLRRMLYKFIANFVIIYIAIRSTLRFLNVNIGPSNFLSFEFKRERNLTQYYVIEANFDFITIHTAKRESSSEPPLLAWIRRASTDSLV